jgi:hypothetical protein
MASNCPACGAPAFPAGGLCGRCGYASGEANRCPHCNAVARTEGRGLRTICAVCGGPRVPHNEGGEASARLLKNQKAHLAAARLASAATVFQAIFAALATLVGLALAPASIAEKMFLFAIALVPLVLALRSRARAKSEREAADRAGEDAWQAAAEAIAAGAPQGITASSLAKALDVEEEHADRLLTALTVHDRTRVDVGDDAEVVYSVPPDRLREEDDERDEREGRAR